MNIGKHAKQGAKKACVRVERFGWLNLKLFQRLSISVKPSLTLFLLLSLSLMVGLLCSIAAVMEIIKTSLCVKDLVFFCFSDNLTGLRSHKRTGMAVLGGIA